MRNLYLTMVAVSLSAAVMGCEDTASTPAKPGEAQIETAAKGKVAEVQIANQIAQNCDQYKLSPEWPSVLENELKSLGPNVEQPQINSSEYRAYLKEYSMRVGASEPSDASSWCALGDASVVATEQATSSVGKMLMKMGG